MDTISNTTSDATVISKIFVGIDLASKIIQISFKDFDGKTHDYALEPAEFIEFIQKHRGKPYVFAMEACGTSNFWATFIKQEGYEVYILPAKACRTYNRGQKDDRGDARGVRDALTLYSLYPEAETFKPCIIRDSVNQQEMYMLKSYADVKSRITALNRKLIAYLRELDPQQGYSYMMTAPQTIAHIKKWIADNQNTENTTGGLFALLELQCSELELCAVQLLTIEKEFMAKYAQDNEICQELLTVDGIGIPLAVGISVYTQDDFSRYKDANAFVAAMHLFPCHKGTGGKNRVGKLSPEGNPILKGLFYEGGNSLLVAENKTLPKELKIDLRDKRKKISYAKQIALNAYNTVAGHDRSTSQSIQNLSKENSEEDTTISGNSSETKTAQSKPAEKKIIRNKESKFRSKLRKLQSGILELLYDHTMYSVFKEITSELIFSVPDPIKDKISEPEPWQQAIITEMKQKFEKKRKQIDVYMASLEFD